MSMESFHDTRQEATPTGEEAGADPGGEAMGTPRTGRALFASDVEDPVVDANANQSDEVPASTPGSKRCQHWITCSTQG